MRRFIFVQIGIFLAAFPGLAVGAPDNFIQESQEQWEESVRAKQRWGARNRELASLYMQRFQRNVTAEVIKFADGSGGDTIDQRNRAIIILGRLEDPLAESTLEQMWTTVKAQERKLLEEADFSDKENAMIQSLLTHEYPIVHRVSPPQLSGWHLSIALARVRARDLKGIEKLDAIAQSIGLTWAQVQGFGDLLKAAAQGTGNRGLLRGSYPRDVVTEFLDVLRTMGRKGEDLEAVGASRLAYFEALGALFTNSRLSRSEEAKFWLKGAMAPAQRGFYPRDILALGEDMKPILLSALQESLATYKRNPQIFKDLSLITLRGMFITASATGDPMYHPILKEFSQVDAKNLAYEAALAMGNLQTGKGASQIFYDS